MPQSIFPGEPILSDSTQNEFIANKVVQVFGNEAGLVDVSLLDFSPVVILTSVAGTNTITGSAVLNASTPYIDGFKYTFIVPNTNTGNVSININNTGDVDILSKDGQTLEAGDLQNGYTASIIYIDGDFYLIHISEESFYTYADAGFTVAGQVKQAGDTIDDDTFQDEAVANTSVDVFTREDGKIDQSLMPSGLIEVVEEIPTDGSENQVIILRENEGDNVAGIYRYITNQWVRQ